MGIIDPETGFSKTHYHVIVLHLTNGKKIRAIAPATFESTSELNGVRVNGITFGTIQKLPDGIIIDYVENNPGPTPE